MELLNGDVILNVKQIKSDVFDLFVEKIKSGELEPFRLSRDMILVSEVLEIIEKIGAVIE